MDLRLGTFQMSRCGIESNGSVRNLYLLSGQFVPVDVGGWSFLRGRQWFERAWGLFLQCGFVFFGSSGEVVSFSTWVPARVPGSGHQSRYCRHGEPERLVRAAVPCSGSVENPEALASAV